MTDKASSKYLYSFKDYQEVEVNGEVLPGQRSLKYRTSLFLKSDIKDSTILDIGCNLGQILFFCLDNGAKSGIGIDHDYNTIQKAKEINKNTNINFLCEDIDNPFLYTNIPNFDVSFVLSVIGTDGLQNRYGMLSKIDSITKKVLYLEGHHGKNFHKNKLIESILLYTTFKTIEYFGVTYDNKQCEKRHNGRHLFRCSRENFTFNNACDKIDKIINQYKNQKILIIGSRLKTSEFKIYLDTYLNTNNYKKDGNAFIKDSKNLSILDDHEIIENNKNFSHIIYFNYKIYRKDIFKDVNTVFIIDYYNINDKDLDNDDRSVNFLNYNIERIYHVDK